MKKFRFEAIDTAGQVKRGVLQALSQQEARMVLLDNEIHPKRLEEVGGEEKVTWAPKRRRREEDPASHFYKGAADFTPPVRALFDARILLGEKRGTRGRAGMTGDGSFSFESADGKPENSFAVARAELEVARLAGFLPRVLRLVRLDGKMHEFAVGGLFAPAGAKELVKQLKTRR